jgi:uncharacterized protein (TIGR04255 family)
VPHPSYSNPTIQEALCELHFASEQDAGWSPNKPAPLIDRLRDSYQDFETITEAGYQIVISPDGGLMPMPLQPKLKLKFSRREQPFLLHFLQGQFVINVLRPYPGWGALRSELLRVWPIAREILRPAAVTRIGMRYINRIPLRTRTETPGTWLKHSQYVPRALLDSGPDFLARLELRKDGTNRLVTTIAHDKTAPAEPFGSLILDIDRISENRLDTDNDTIGQSVDTFPTALSTLQSFQVLLTSPLQRSKSSHTIRL